MTELPISDPPCEEGTLMYSYNNTNDKNNNSLRESVNGPRKSSPPGRDVPGPSLSKAHIRPRIEFVSGASLLKSSKGITCDAVGGGKRNSIKGFSIASRRRLLYLIGAIRKDAVLPCFVTLTYPDEFPTVETAKRDLKVFLQRLDRKFENAGYIWKLEPQKRGAPHYHLLVWGVEWVELAYWVVRSWYEIAGHGDYKHYLFHSGQLEGTQLCVQQVRSWRGVWSYAAKYIGKVFEVAEWGSLWTGRFWGVGKRKNIPFGEKIEFDVTYSEAVQLQRLQRRFSGIRRSQRNSMTIFCDADQWITKLFFHRRQ